MYLSDERNGILQFWEIEMVSQRILGSTGLLSSQKLPDEIMVQATVWQILIA